MKAFSLSLLSVLMTALCLGPAGNAQEMVKVNILKLYDKVPPVPANAKEAYGRCSRSEDGNSLDEAAFFKSIEDSTKALQSRLEKLLMALDKPTIDKYNTIDQKAVQQKMKSMSKEERVAYAMELSKQMGLGPKSMVPESPSVNAAVQEVSHANATGGKNIQQAGEIFRLRSERNQRFDQRHSDIDKWKSDEETKLPEISTGEMSYPEPKAYRALEIQAAEKHIAVANDNLKAIQEDFHTDHTKALEQFTTVQEKLAAIHYGDDARNPEIKRMLVGGQMQMLPPLSALIKYSREATATGAKWYLERVKAGESKP